MVSARDIIRFQREIERERERNLMVLARDSKGLFGSRER